MHAAGPSFRRAFLGLLAALLFSAPALRAQAVTAIEVQPAPGRTAASYLARVTQPLGQPVDPAQIRASIESLYATGDFDGIQAVAYPAAAGVRLVFTTQPRYFLALIRFDHAPDPATDSELADASGLELGQTFSHASVDEALVKVQTRLRGYGYYQAALQPQITLDAKTAQASVVVGVVPGPVVRAGTIAFSGAAPGASGGAALATPARLLAVSKLKTGEPLPRHAIDQAIAALQTFYAAQDRLTASVTVAAQTYNPATNRIALTFAIDPGPRVTVAAEGLPIPPGALKKQVPVYQEHAADAALVEEGRGNLETYLQSKGYFEATVAYRRVQVNSGEVRILYLITPGPRETLDAIHFSGNRYFDDGILAEHIATRAASSLPAPIPGARGHFSTGLGQTDANAIVQLYRANGFRAAQVTAAVDRNYRGRPDHIGVTFHVAEGPQSLVHALDISGVTPADRAQILNLLATAPGQPYADVNVVNDRDAILTYFYNAGFATASCETRTSAAAVPGQVDVAFTIAQGEAETIHNVFINGDHFVHRNVIADQLRLTPGQPLSQLAMLQSQRNLYDSGLFNDVTVAPRNPDGLELAKDVQVTVTEASRYTFSEGVGLQIQGGTGNQGELADVLGTTGYSPLLSFDATRTAMAGRDQTLSFKSTYGTLQKRAVLGYEMPGFLNHRSLNLDVTTFYDDTFDVRTFRAIREQGGLQLEQNLGAGTGIDYGVDYHRVQVLDPEVAAQEIPILSEPVQIAEGTVNYHRDHRDNPLDSHRGTYNTFQITLAKSYGGDALAGQPANAGFADFGRAFYQNSWYHAFGKRGQFVFARSTQAGVEVPFGRHQLISATNPVTGVTTTDLESVIPLPERFLSGGADSLRGFDINQAGPRDPITGFPVGGDALLINNLELRFPLVQNIGGVVFYDYGNVYSTPAQMARSLFRLRPSSAGDFDFSSHTVGLGVRYGTPVGPVRLDTGYLLNPPTFQAFTAQPLEYNQRLPAFHFFFSIGQTF